MRVVIQKKMLLLIYNYSLIQGNNAAFQYSIQSNGAFDIEPLSGEIYTTAQFETDGPSATSSYNFEV